jgi:DNA-binding transcriptional LysR family regulator
MSGTPADYPLLAIFVAVAEQTSFTKAAKRLGIGKGTVSRAVAELERQLGVELLHRTTHTVALSTAGLALYERTAPHLAALDQAVQKLPERAADPSGELRMTAPHDFGLVALPEIIVGFTRRFPEIRVDVRLTNARLDLVAESIDLAIRASPRESLKDSSLTVRRLGTSAVGFFAAPAYFARRGKPRQVDDSGHEWIWHRSVLAAQKRSPRSVGRFLCDDFLFIRELARAGAGVALMPNVVAAPYVRDGLLEEVALADRPLGGALFLLYPSSGQVPRKVSAFRDYLLERLKNWPLA